MSITGDDNMVVPLRYLVPVMNAACRYERTAHDPILTEAIAAIGSELWELLQLEKALPDEDTAKVAADLRRIAGEERPAGDN